MIEENEIVKIKMNSGRIITLTIHQRTTTHLHGTDKFCNSTIVPIAEIDSMFTLRGDEVEE